MRDRLNTAEKQLRAIEEIGSRTSTSTQSSFKVTLLQLCTVQNLFSTIIILISKAKDVLFRNRPFSFTILVVVVVYPTPSEGWGARKPNNPV